MAEREANGRFAKGNQIAKGHDGSNAGRPPRAVEEQYMHALMQAMPIDQFLKTCKVHAARAQAGDLATFRTFLERLLGRPIDYKEHAGEVVLRIKREKSGTDRSDEDAPSPAATGQEQQSEAQDSPGG